MRRPIITNSERSTAACSHRWLLRYGLGLRQHDTTPTLYVGTLVHAAVEALYNLPPGAPWTTSVATTAVQRAAQDYVAKLQAQRGAALFGEEVELVTTCTQQATKLACDYVRHWRGLQLAGQLGRMVLNETTFAVQPGAKLRAKYAGKVDRVVELHGQLWLVETKTTTLALQDYVARNRWNAQTMAYAVALRKSHNLHVVGVIYDLVNSKPSKAPHELPTLKDGSRLAKPAGLPYCTASTFAQALRTVHQCELDHALQLVDWYQQTYSELVQRDAGGFWYHREPVLFDQHELHRAAGELEAAVARIAGWHRKVDRLALQRQQDGTLPASEVVRALDALQFDLPREPALCWQYNRLCTYASLCASHSTDDVHKFAATTAANGHEELTHASDAGNE